jgi:hypothetical protein
MEVIGMKEFGGPDWLKVSKWPFSEPDEQLLLDRTKLNEHGLKLDNPEGFADE